MASKFITKFSTDLQRLVTQLRILNATERHTISMATLKVFTVKNVLNIKPEVMLLILLHCLSMCAFISSVDLLITKEERSIFEENLNAISKSSITNYKHMAGTRSCETLATKQHII